MKRAATVVLILLALAVSVLAADISGKWKTTAPGGDGGDIIFTFKVDGDKLTGSVAGPMGDMPISDGKLEGNNITFSVAMGDNKIVHKGTVSANEIKLKVDMGMGGEPMEFILKRV
jgi:hypothetical protein